MRKKHPSPPARGESDCGRRPFAEVQTICPSGLGWGTILTKRGGFGGAFQILWGFHTSPCRLTAASGSDWPWLLLPDTRRETVFCKLSGNTLPVLASPSWVAGQGTVRAMKARGGHFGQPHSDAGHRPCGGDPQRHIQRGSFPGLQSFCKRCFLLGKEAGALPPGAIHGMVFCKSAAR